ncbi:MAG: hypothetical protein GTO63_23540, partial [Anaerolineae bacterium]|nr:hypothetical protein [Anaerolineae bacterium]
GELLPIGGRALVGLGSLALERYDLPQAERLLRDGIRYVERWNILASLDGQVWMAMLHFAQGNTEALGDSL